MDRFTDQARISNAVKFGLFLVAGYVLLSATSTAATSEDRAIPAVDRNEGSSKHICSFPEFGVTADETKCDEFAAAYAIAVANLRDAVEAADHAYEEWYECELSNDEAAVQSPVISAEYSVLEHFHY